MGLPASVLIVWPAQHIGRRSCRLNTDKAQISTKILLFQKFLLLRFILIAKYPIFILVTGLKFCERACTYHWLVNPVYNDRQNALYLWKTNTLESLKWKHFSWMYFSMSTVFQITRLLLMLKLRKYGPLLHFYHTPSWDGAKLWRNV
jgi:hypothetical protein